MSHIGNGKKGKNKAKKPPRYNLRERVLAQYHATGTHDSRDEHHETEPPYRVKREDNGKG